MSDDEKETCAPKRPHPFDHRWTEVVHALHRPGRGGKLSLAATRKIIGPVTVGVSPGMTIEEIAEKIRAHREGRIDE